MKKYLILFCVLSAFAVASHLYFLEKNTRKNFAFLQLEKFPYDDDVDCYQAGFPEVSFGNTKTKQAVLLLHGFASAPSEFLTLSSELKKANIPYYAPLFTGFGLKNFHLLNTVESTDWMRDALFAFDLLSKSAEKITVIGHSNGGDLAVWLATKRPLAKLILLDPYLSSFSSFSLDVSNFLLSRSWSRRILSFLWPVVWIHAADIEDPRTRNAAFQFKAVPMQAVDALFSMQRIADKQVSDLRNWASSGNSISLFYGEQDETADMHRVIQRFQKGNIPFQQFSYRRSGHDPLQDYDRNRVASDILQIIQPKPL